MRHMGIKQVCHTGQYIQVYSVQGGDVENMVENMHELEHGTKRYVNPKRALHSNLARESVSKKL